LWKPCRRAWLPGQGRNGLGDNFRRERTDRVNTQDFTVFGIGHDLDEAFVLAENCCLAIGEKWEFADFDIEASFPRLFLR